ncbi:MAG TPA: DUF1697 domain-containing protein [Micromonosporaceae bacterium]|jgi:uncharacterized protein (DUF1697 family)|nr:DUF1697 domain-containing protein [Micromonosporaceae bacterium]
MAATRQVALLRGINVGRNKRIAMARLRQVLEELDYADVRTLLQSGNAVFTSAKRPDRVAREIEQRIETDLDMQVSVVVRTEAELTAVVDANPMPEHTGEPSRFFVVFLAQAPDAQRVAGVDAAELLPDVLHISGREAYLWCPNGVLGSKVPANFWDKRLGVVATARNWSTVTKLADLAAAK